MASVSRSIYFRYPATIRQELLHDQELMARIGVPSGRVITFAGTLSVPEVELFEGVRRVLGGGTSVEANDINNNAVHLSVVDGVVQLRDSRAFEQGLPLPYFHVLSPDAGARVAALEGLIRRYGPTSPDFSGYIATARRRELSYAEIGELFVELQAGVPAAWRRAATAFAKGEVNVEDVVPNDLSYFERFCGPDPKMYGPEIYLTTLLPRQRKQLLARDIRAALDICMVGALHDALYPGEWLSSCTNDELWQILEDGRHRDDPYSLLALLDIAIRRDEDERYRNLAEEMVTLLVNDSLSDETGSDAYELLPLFADLTLERLNTNALAAARAPYWRRMCAWMHAGMLTRLSRNRNVDPASMRDWIQAQLTHQGLFRNIVDLRREPMFSAMLTTREALRGELMGRVALLEARYQGTGRSFPKRELLEEWFARGRSPKLPLMAISPGPLQGDLRPRKPCMDQMKASDMQRLMEKLEKDPLGHVWTGVAQLSQCCLLEEVFFERAIKAISIADMSQKPTGELGLMDAALVAIAASRRDLAEAVVAAILKVAERIDESEHVVHMMQTALLASCCIDDETDWRHWLKAKLVEMAYSLPPEHAVVQAFDAALVALDRVTVTYDLGMTTKARAVIASV